ncbi:MAG: BCSC C-terminal domain-containing protein [Acetobacteraceae bacterium]|nr:BCSC C-terminal domain-containing protein [Acetobacteraceae bacterium]
MSRLLLGAALAFGSSAAAFAQTPPQAVVATAQPPAQSASRNPLAVLMDQANYWRQQGRNDLALAALHRTLLLDPGNADALALSAELNADRGERAAADQDLAKLRAAHPDDPRLAAIAQTLRVGPLDQAAVAQARDLARQGHAAEAIDRYRALFHGTAPPDSMAVEYYQVLAGTENGWDAARNGLAQAVARNPQDTRGQLAYAQLLTYRPATRADGIGRLAILARNPATADNASATWRQALDWLPTDAASVPLYEAYLAAHPNDPGITQKLADARNPRRTPADEAGLDRQHGFAALQANRVSDAEAAFEAALKINGEDADALGGLGLVRQRQGKDAEARDLLERAVAAAPDKATQWQAALNGATIGTAYASARALARSGQYAQAAEQLRTIIAHGGDVTGAQAMLAEMQAKGGDLAGAEASYRAVLAHQPDNGAALVGLANVLTRRGRDAEAQTLLARAEATGHGQAAGQARAQQLRVQAQGAADPQTAIALLRRASSEVPSDPWIRLDLARLLARQGQGAEAQQVMAALTEQPRPAPEALHAAALFAMETNHPSEAAALAERVPPGSRSADMTRLLADARFDGEVRRIVADAAISGDARPRLLALAATPDPTGARGAAIVRAFAKLNDPAGARQAIAVALASNRNPTPSVRIAYAGALLAAGQVGDAGKLIASVDLQGSLTPEQRTAVAGLRDGIAVQTSDRLNQDGRTADAYDQLAPALRQSPDDPDLNLALARLYQTARDPRQALDIAEALLRRDPGNLEARRAAVSARIEMGNLDEAALLVSDGRTASPDDPRMWLMAADVARARGDNGEVLRDLRTAQTLRREQIAGDTAPTVALAAAPGPAPSDNPFRGDSTPPAMQVADAGGILPGAPAGSALTRDPMSRDIARDIAAAEGAVAPYLSLGAGYRNRSGSTGLDALNEATAPLEGSMSPGGYGRLTVTATPTSLTNGQLQDSTAARQQFGTLVFGGPLPGSQQATGVALSAAYKYRWIAADIGTTPIGFRVQNIVGGVEVSPELADGVRLRSRLERRAVTDSLLSYAGTVDPGTGQTFGGVVREGGNSQLELTAGLANFYAGGGYSQFTGHSVENNSEASFGAGGSYPIYRNKTDELRAGLDLVSFTYAKNLDHFTLGHGGYFSPQTYFAGLIPLSFTQTRDDLTWSVGGSLGVQSYTEKSSPVFPTNGALQARLDALAATNPTIVTSYPSTSQTGMVGGAHGSIEYQATPSLRFGGLLRYDRAGNWSETAATVFARYIFDPPEALVLK